MSMLKNDHVHRNIPRKKKSTVCSEIKHKNDLHYCRNVNIKDNSKLLNDSKAK